MKNDNHTVFKRTYETDRLINCQGIEMTTRMETTRCPRVGYEIEIVDGCCELKACGLCDRKCELMAAMKQIKEKRFRRVKV